MKIHVVADGDHNVVGTMVVRPASAEGYRSTIFPVHEDHSLHRLEVSDEFADLPPQELHLRLKEHLDSSS
jgi:hypothetical protein